MAVYTILPKTNVTMDDVKDTLNANKGNVTNVLGTFFSEQARINRWALYKPVKGGADFFDTTDEYKTWLKTVYCGLTPQRNTLLEEACVNYSGTKVAHDYDEVLKVNKEWTYTPPNARPYRLGDFRGYRADAIPPDGGYTDYTFVKKDLTKLQNTTVNATTGGYDWYIGEGNTFARLSGLSIKTGEQSWQGVNQSQLQDIPISYIQGDIRFENWRFGIAVYIDTLVTNAKWQLIVSDMTFAKIDTDPTLNAFALPDLMTNQQAIGQMLQSTSDTFRYLPCLIKNAVLGRDSSTNTYIAVTPDTQIFSVPSGASGFSLNLVTKIEDSPHDNGRWHVQAKFTGRYTQFGDATYNRVAINSLNVYCDEVLTVDTLAWVQIVFSYVTGVSADGTLVTATNSVIFQNTFSAGTKPDAIIMTQPGLIVNKNETIWYSPKET